MMKIKWMHILLKFINEIQFVDIDGGNTQINKRFVLTFTSYHIWNYTLLYLLNSQERLYSPLQSAQQAVSGSSIIGITATMLLNGRWMHQTIILVCVLFFIYNRFWFKSNSRKCNMDRR